MNKTKIDWADSTWNSVTGCLHGCEYCYARKVAERFDGKSDKTLYMQLKDKPDVFDLYEAMPGEDGRKMPYPFGFEPTFHRYHLDDYKDKKGRTIFVCSMADLFGDWVPDEWIQEVFKTCEAAPQHEYLFLTKNPRKYLDLQYKIPLPTSERYWYGTTVNNSADFIPPCRVEYLSRLMGCKKFLSIEPIFGEIHGIALTNLKCFQWIIVGTETGNRKGKVIPEKDWIDRIVYR